MGILQGTRPPPTRPDAERAPIRLGLARARFGPIDGAWWPYDRDTAGQLRALVAELDGLLPQRVTRVNVQRSGWDDIPRRLSVSARVVSVGWFNSGDPNLITVVTRDGITTQLLVIPPHTAEAAASTAMAIAMSGTNSAQPGAILAAGRAISDDDEWPGAPTEAESVWLGEGGSRR